MATLTLEQVLQHFMIIRSKDAGPFMLTFDLIFETEDFYRAFTSAKILSPELMQRLYGVDPAEVLLFEIPALKAVKLSFPRSTISGAFGDRDISGGQQYGPLIDYLTTLEVEYEPVLAVHAPS